MLVCPDCGNRTFTERHNRAVDVAIQYFTDGSPYETGSEEIVDSEANDEFRCDGCFTTFYGPEDLTTEEAYNDES